MSRNTLTLFFTCLLASRLYSSSGTAGGNITVSSVWNSDTVNVTEDVTIADGATLSIESGTCVLFTGHYKINVQGRIVAAGLENDSVTFTSSDTALGWAGLRFENTANSNDSSILSHCSFKYGKANGVDNDKLGGAILVSVFSKIRISNSSFFKCITDGYKSYGGAICFIQSSAIVTNCTFTSNSSIWGGGAIYCSGTPSPKLMNLYLNDNVADMGGAIYCVDAAPEISNTQIISNSAVKGCGIFCSKSSAVITNSVFYKNNSHGAATIQGGGLYCESTPSPTVNSCTFLNNDAAWGGGVYSLGSEATITNSTFTENNSVTGGGLLINGSTISIIGCAIIANKGSAGGGIFIQSSSSPVIINSTISYNKADSLGGGIYITGRSKPSIHCNLEL